MLEVEPEVHTEPVDTVEAHAVVAVVKETEVYRKFLVGEVVVLVVGPQVAATEAEEVDNVAKEGDEDKSVVRRRTNLKVHLQLEYHLTLALAPKTPINSKANRYARVTKSEGVLDKLICATLESPFECRMFD